MTDDRSENKEPVEDLDVPESESDDVKGGTNFSKLEFESRPPTRKAGKGELEIESFSWGA